MIFAFDIDPIFESECREHVFMMLPTTFEDLPAKLQHALSTEISRSLQRYIEKQITNSLLEHAQFDLTLCVINFERKNPIDIKITKAVINQKPSGLNVDLEVSRRGLYEKDLVRVRTWLLKRLVKQGEKPLVTPPATVSRTIYV